MPTASRLNYNRRVYKPTDGKHLECLALVTGDAAPLGSTRHLLCRATLPTLGDVAALLYTEKHAKRHNQSEESKKHVAN